MKFLMLVVAMSVLGCAHAPNCYRVSTVDTWVLGGPAGWNSRSDSTDYYGDLTDNTHSNGKGWSAEVGVNMSWSPSECEWLYEDEEESTQVNPGAPSPR
jgi:hypothetical protein